jgi:hypothetical protein
MPPRPIANQAMDRRRQRAGDNSTGFNGDHGPIALVSDMKMRRRMVGKEHPHGNAEKNGDRGHRISPKLLCCRTVYPLQCVAGNSV